MLFNGVIHRNSFEWSFEADCFPIYFCICCSIYIDGSFFKELLRRIHHPQIIFVSSIEFKNCKFRIVCAVHSLVSEISREFVYPVKSPNDQSFQIQFIGNAQVHGNIQCIVMRCKRSGCRSTRNALQYWCIHFNRSSAV